MTTTRPEARRRTGGTTYFLGRPADLWRQALAGNRSRRPAAQSH